MRTALVVEDAARARIPSAIRFRPRPLLLYERMFLTASDRLRSWLHSVNRAVDELLAGDAVESLFSSADPLVDPEASSEAGASRRHAHPHKRAVARSRRPRRPGELASAPMVCVSPLPRASTPSRHEEAVRR